MLLKKILLNLSLSTFAFLIFVQQAKADIWSREIYSQSVYLHKYKNPITQNKFTVAREMKNVDVYAGMWVDHDEKTDAKEAYTDAQISPLLGLRTKVFGNDWMYSRLFLESRLVHRTKPFPDDRIRTTYEVRGGLIGYGLKVWDETFFLENYYSFFYTRLYSERFIFQGWARQGLRFVKHLELFNELFVDTFDFTRDSDPTYDLRPGVRFRWDFSNGSFQLIHQRLHHFTNLAFAGRNESRSMMVFGIYW